VTGKCQQQEGDGTGEVHHRDFCFQGLGFVTPEVQAKWVGRRYYPKFDPATGSRKGHWP
jgi:maltoporin